MNLGITTDVKVEKSNRSSTRVFIDGRRAPEAKTTLAAVKQVLGMSRGPFKVEVNHRCQVPIGAGYGASGAGALGTALALSRALGLRAPRERAVAAAHVAEVTCYTGLGDVGAQAFGGLVIGMEPGAPPYGRWRRMIVPPGIKVVCATLGPIQTKEFLRDAGFRKRAGELGRAALDDVLKQSDIRRFVSVSRDFAEKLGLLDDELEELVEAAVEAGAIGASQAMLGRTVFALANVKKIDSVRDAFLNLLEKESVMVADIYERRARIGTA